MITEGTASIASDVKSAHPDKAGFLAAMPEWEFILVAHEGLLSEPHAGATYKDVYYSERDIHIAWFLRNPESDPLW